MTTAEIQALVTQRRAVKIPPTADGCYNYDDPLCAAIETLLARDNIKAFAEQEVRIAELEAQCAAFHAEASGHYQANLATIAELARVKAESLRVVECGEVCELQDCMVEYCFIEGKDRLNFASEFAKQHYPTMRVQPVRLERWGNEGEIVRWPSGAIFTADDAHHGLTGE